MLLNNYILIDHRILWLFIFNIFPPFEDFALCEIWLCRRSFEGTNYLHHQDLSEYGEKHLHDIGTWHWKVRVSFFAIYIHSNEIHNVAALTVYWCSGVSSTCFGQLYQRDVSDSAVLTTYHSLHIQHLKETLLRMDRYGPKHVELTPEY